MDFLFAGMHYVPMKHKYIKHDTHIPADLQTNSLYFDILLNSARDYMNFWIFKQLNKVIFLEGKSIHQYYMVLFCFS